MAAERKTAGCVSDKRKMRLAHSPRLKGESRFGKPFRMQSGEKD